MEIITMIQQVIFFLFQWHNKQISDFTSKLCTMQDEIIWKHQRNYEQWKATQPRLKNFSTLTHLNIEMWWVSCFVSSVKQNTDLMTPTDNDAP